MPKRHLALDLAGRFGFAVGCEYPEASGSILIPPGEIEERFAWLWRWLDEAITEHLPDQIVFESPMIKPTDDLHTVRLLSGFCCVAGTLSVLRGIPVVEANVRTVRRHFLGDTLPKGRDEQKAAVMKMCRLRGWRARDDNVGDAMALLDFVIAADQRSARISRGEEPCRNTSPDGQKKTSKLSNETGPPDQPPKSPSTSAPPATP